MIFLGTSPSDASGTLEAVAVGTLESVGTLEVGAVGTLEAGAVVGVGTLEVGAVVGVGTLESVGTLEAGSTCTSVAGFGFGTTAFFRIILVILAGVSSRLTCDSTTGGGVFVLVTLGVIFGTSVVVTGTSSKYPSDCMPMSRTGSTCMFLNSSDS